MNSLQNARFAATIGAGEHIHPGQFAQSDPANIPDVVDIKTIQHGWGVSRATAMGVRRGRDALFAPAFSGIYSRIGMTT
jgi:hypothetical protein